MAYEDDPIPRLKRETGAEIARALTERDTRDAAVFMRTDAPRVSDLRRRKLRRFSLETLIRYLSRLGYRIELRLAKRRLNEHRKE